MTATEASVADRAPSAGLSPTAEDEGRACAYSVLAALLRSAPGADLLDHIGSLGLVCDSDGALGQAWSALRAAIDGADDAAIAREYHDLFIGLGRGELVPYGSYFITGFLMEKPLAVLRDDLARLGFTRQDDVREPEDHVAALCEVMSVLVAGEEPVDLETQRTFFDTHMASWIGRFFSDLQRAESARFYVAVGAFGASFVDVERAAFAMTV